MTEFTTIKVSKKTKERLHRLVGELTKIKGKRVTLEDAIIHLLGNKENIEQKSPSSLPKIDRDRQAILTLMKQKFYGAGPEDYKEYDFDDIGD